MSLFREYATSKLGSAQVVQLAVTTWTEIVLSTLVQGQVPQPRSFIVTPANDVYAAQGNHALTANGVTITLPANPATATSGTGPGYTRLIADMPWRIDVERKGENSLWLFAAAQTIVVVTEITGTIFD